MSKTYSGRFTLEWYNKQKSMLIQAEENARNGDIPAPKINWVNKEESLFYEIDENQGKGIKPYWVDRNDIRVKEARPLIFKKAFKAVPKDVEGSLQGMNQEWTIKEIDDENDAIDIENILIKGDNLLALNTLKKHFDKLPDERKVKCIYIDPPYNTGNAFGNYDDNLAISEWLTLIRDRILLLKSLLKEDGVIFISIDDNACQLKLICDEIFGINNYCGYFIWEKKKKPAFLSKMGTLTEQIFVYAKNKTLCPNFIYGTTTEGKKYPLNNAGNGLKTLKFSAKSVRFKFKDKTIPPQEMSEGNIITILKNEVIVSDYLNENDFYLEGEWRYSQQTLDEIISNGDEIYISQIPFRPNHIKRGGEPKKIHNLLSINHYNIDTYEDATSHSEYLFGSGAFDYPKPEKLISTLLNSICYEGDLVMDSFAGSGTTLSVATKMNLKWIGVELGNHANTHIIPRLKKVILNNDKMGITNNIGYIGGGSFKYYHLGDSIIKFTDGNTDFNWDLDLNFIMESFLHSYDYQLIDNSFLTSNELFEQYQVIPKIGIQTIGSRNRIAIITLQKPDEKDKLVTYDELMFIYTYLDKQYKPDYINVFTNRGVNLAFDSKPQNLEIIKIPQAIISELEK